MTMNFLGPFRSRPTTALSSEAANPPPPSESFETHRTSLGWRLLRVGAAEAAANGAERSQAWIAGLLPERGRAAQSSSTYLARVQSMGEATPDIETLRRIANAAPQQNSRVLGELASILQENDPELFAESLLSMGRRHLDQHPQVALVALHAATEFSFTSSRAQRLIDAAEGRGGFGAQFELQAPRLLRELSSPLMLASFGSGIFVARAASLATLSRFSRLGWGSLIASEGAALALEAPAMVVTHRLGERFFHGGAALLAPPEVARDVMAAYAPFALLRFSGNAMNLGAPWLRRNLALESSFGARAFSGIRFGAELGSLMLGHRINAVVGLEPGVSGSQALYQGLLSLGHMRISGRMVESLGLGSLGPLWESQRHELLRRNRDEIFFDGNLGGALAFAGVPSLGIRRATRSESLIPEPMFMTKDGDGTGSSGSGGGGNSRSSPSRRALVIQALSQNLGEYAKAAENQDTFLGRVAKRLHSTLEKPELVQDESFARALAEMESELEAVNEHGNVAKRTYAQLRILLRGGAEESAPREEPVLPPEVEQQVEQQVENIARDEADRGALTSSLARMKEVFKQARQFGWSEDLYAQLVAAKNRLNELYRSSSSWKVPGLDRLLRRGDPEALLQRRQGALLGLAVLNGHETATVRALRDPAAPPSSDGNLELELIHQSILTAARRTWQPEALDAEVLGLAARFGAGEESAAAMLLSAATVRRLVEGGPKPADLLEWMSGREESHYFGDRLLQLRAFRGMNPEPGRGLQQLTSGANAPDYWFTGLQLYLQSQGEATRLNQGLETARRARIGGFHPSVAVSLFGAAHGRKNLPQRLWSADLEVDEYLQRALEPEIK